MTVGEIADAAKLKIHACPDPDALIDGVYIGDLLSWVMGRAQAGQAWITIMSNNNIVAVASLVGVSCIVLAEGVIPDGELTQLAVQKGINLLSSELPAYETAMLVSKQVST